MDERVKKSLIEIVGEKNFNDKLIDMVSYSYDASEYTHRPLCAVWVESTEQVSEVLKPVSYTHLTLPTKRIV